MLDPAPNPALADWLRRHRATLAASWMERIGSSSLRHYREQPRDDVARWSGQLIDALAAAATYGDASELDRYVERLTPARYQLGFGVEEVLQACLLLQEVAWPVLLAEPASLLLGSSLSAYLRLLVARFARAFVLAMRAQQEHVVALEERQRLARDLHDSVSQSLCGVTMYAEAASRQLAAGQVATAMDHLAQLRTDALDAVREMRRMIYDRRPPTLEARGLEAALRERLAAVEARAGVDAHLVSDLAGRLPPDLEDALYGVAQEALTNATRHGHATRVRVVLQRDHGAVLMRVEDNGRGFDPALASRSGGLGLQGMRERLARVDGELTIDAAPSRGSCIAARVAGAVEAEA